jgi:hypothetical protein
MDNSRHSQPDLPLPAAYRASVVWSAMLERCRAVADVIGRKEVAYDLDTQRTRLDHALFERDRHHLRGLELVYLVLRGDAPQILEPLHSELALVVAPQQPLTTAEKLSRLERAIAGLGPIGQQLLTEAYRR